MRKILVTVATRSSRNEIIGSLDNDELKIRLTAPPVDGEANKKLIELLAAAFHVSKSHVTIVKGLTSKKKTVEIGD